MNVAEEVKRDFEMSLKKIDFSSYDPASPDFLNALSIGKMWELLTKLSENYSSEEITVDKESEKEKEDEISEKISKAKMYVQKYIDSKDELYKTIAIDELNHVEILLKKAYSRLPNAEEKAKLKNYDYEKSEILKQLN